MCVDEVHEFCLNFEYVTEDFPFDEHTLTIKLFDSKIFAILPLDTPDRINLKCDPDLALELRDKYEGIVPGYHCNKKHWNTVFINKDVPIEKIKKLISHSYDLVYKNIPKNLKNECQN